jgi:hypothetical protein
MPVLRKGIRGDNAFEQEDWHKEIYEEDPDNAPKLFMNAPKKYEKHFLDKLDKRGQCYNLLKTSFDEITNDLGGEETLSHVQLTLIERFCFMEFVLRLKEIEMAKPYEDGDKEKFGKQVASWTQSINAMIGLAKTIGLERRAKQVANLRDYVKSKQDVKKKRKRKRTKQKRELIFED